MKNTKRIASVRRVTKAAAALAIAALFALRLFPNQAFAASETVVKSSAPDQMWVGDEGTFSFYLYGNGANPKKDATVTTKPKGRLATSKIHYKKLRWSSGGSGTSFFTMRHSPSQQRKRARQMSPSKQNGPVQSPGRSRSWRSYVYSERKIICIRI